VHTVCACAKYSIVFSVKSFVHFLVSTNQGYRAFFEIYSSNDLTYRSLLGYFSDVAVSFLQTWKGNNL